MTTNMPAKLISIKDAAIDFAYNRGPLPLNIDDLYKWLYWESDDESFQDYNFWVTLHRLDLSDSAVIYDLFNNQQKTINDGDRIKYARLEISKLGTNDDLISTNEFRIENSNGEFTYICCTVESGGQGGPIINWHGLFQSKEDFWIYLQSKFNYYPCDRLEEISNDEILKHWYYG